MDKNAKLINQFSSLGFGFIEIGTVTPKSQSGNPKKRLFRLLSDEGIINRMGFNNDGVEAIASRLKKKGDVIVGGNIGKNKITPIENAVSDYLISFEYLFDLVDYFAINVSSPNTENLRDLQNKDNLISLLSAIQKNNHTKNNPKPILLKIAPDLSNDQLLSIIDVVNQTSIDGIIATNTTIERKNLKSSKTLIKEQGGLSGAPLTNRSTEIIRSNQIIKAKNYSLQLVAAGGVSDHYTAYAKILSGANLVQLYTAMTYSGPMIGDNIINGIISLMKRDKVSDLKNIRGIASDENIAIKMAKNGIQSV